jgi:hypothetical protein
VVVEGGEPELEDCEGAVEETVLEVRESKKGGNEGGVHSVAVVDEDGKGEGEVVEGPGQELHTAHEVLVCLHSADSINSMVGGGWRRRRIEESGGEVSEEWGRVGVSPSRGSEEVVVWWKWRVKLKVW